MKSYDKGVGHEKPTGKHSGKMKHGTQYYKGGKKLFTIT